MEGHLQLSSPPARSSLAPAPLKPDKPVDLALTGPDGKRVHLKESRVHIVVVNFWAIGCGPCKDELPLLVALEKKYRLAASGSSLSRSTIPRRKAKSRILSRNTNWNSRFGRAPRAAISIGSRCATATAFLDEEGRIAARVSGQIREQKLRERIAWLLSGRSGPAPAPFVSHMKD